MLEIFAEARQFAKGPDPWGDFLPFPLIVQEEAAVAIPNFGREVMPVFVLLIGLKDVIICRCRGTSRRSIVPFSGAGAGIA